MQLTTLLIETLKSGKITVSQNNKEALKVNIQNKRIDVNATDKDFIKEILSATREGTTKKGLIDAIHRTVDTASEARKMLPLVKDMAEDLCQEGVTITISYKGDRVMTIGSEADSKLTRLVTGTKGIEINSPRKLAEMGL